MDNKIFIIPSVLIFPQKIGSDDNGDVARCHLVDFRVLGKFGQEADQIPGKQNGMKLLNARQRQEKGEAGGKLNLKSPAVTVCG